MWPWSCWDEASPWWFNASPDLFDDVGLKTLPFSPQLEWEGIWCRGYEHLNGDWQDPCGGDCKSVGEQRYDLPISQILPQLYPGWFDSLKICPAAIVQLIPWLLSSSSCCCLVCHLSCNWFFLSASKVEVKLLGSSLLCCGGDGEVASPWNNGKVGVHPTS